VKHRRLSDEDPTAAILTPKHSRRMPSYLSVDDMFRLLDQATDDTVLGLRNRALFETLYGSGIRVSELTGLNVFDVDSPPAACGYREKEGASGSYRWGKGPGSDSGLSGPAVRAQPVSACEADGPLFLNKNKGRLSARSVGRILEALVSQVQPGRAHFTPRSSGTVSPPTCSMRAPI
jgi:integrase/recombinase XerC